MIFENNVVSFDPKEKIWRGPKVNVGFGPECDIGGEALKALLKDPDHISQISFTSGKEFKNREIATLSIRVAQHFRDHLKIRQSEIIGICGCNSEYLAPLFIGAMLAGLTLNCLDPILDKNSIKHIYSLTKPSIIFCDGDVYERVRDAVDEIKLEVTIYTITNHIAGVPDITEFLQETGNEDAFVSEPLRSGSNQLALIACSSGTTGPPKGVCVSHEALLNQIMLANTLNSIVCFSSLYWMSGVANLLSTTISNNTRIISEKGFNAQDFFEMVEKYKIEGALIPPSQIAMLVADPQLERRDLSSIKLISCGGSTLPDAFIEKVKLYMPNVNILIGYGMTESLGCASGVNPPQKSVGSLLPNVEVKIIDDDGNRLGPNENGEICIKPKFPWAGYYKNATDTSNTYIDGWIHSGDIGYFSDENNLYVVDRKKDILKYKGYSFSPSDIESVIYEMKDVAEVCVFGIPDVVSIFLPAAAVVRVPGSHLTEKEILDHVARNTAHFKHLHGGVFFFEKTFEKTPSGKIIRKIVSDICIKIRAGTDN